MGNPGAISAAVPYGDDAVARQQQDTDTRIREEAADRSLAASQIGAGGHLKVDGTLEVTGDLSVPSGALSSAGSMTAGGAVIAGTSLQGASLQVAGGAVVGSLSSSASMSVGGDFGVSGYLFTPTGYAFDITYTRRAAWLGSDGRLGWASSSVVEKELIDTIDPPKVAAILSLVPRYYQRKVELEKRDNPQSPDYHGPDYHVATEWGALAEDFHAAGLWQVVIYEWTVVYDTEPVLDADGAPVLDADGVPELRRVGEPHRVGEPRPVGLHYELMGLLAIWAAQHVWGEHLALVGRVAALEQGQGL